MALGYKKVKNLFLSFLVFSIPCSAFSQAFDTIVQLTEVVILDSTLRKNIPVVLLEKKSLDLNLSPDLGEILRRESNVSGIRRGGYAIDPVVRGYRYSQISVFLDEGIHIEGGCPNRMDPVMAHVSPAMVNRIELVKGSYMMQYGPAASAGIRVLTRPGYQDFDKGFSGQSISSYDFGRNGYKQYLLMSGSNEKLFIKVSGGIAQSGNYRDGNGKEWNSSFRKKDISADAGLKLGRNGLLVMSYKGSFASDVLFPALPMDERDDKTHIISGYYSLTNPRRHDQRIVITAWHTRVYHLMDNSKRPQYSEVVPPYQGIMQASALVETASSGGRIAITHAHGKFSLNHGIDLINVAKDGTRDMKMIMNMDGQEFITSKSFNLWNDAVIFNSGLFTELKYSSGRLEAGSIFRIDYNKSHSEDTLTILKENLNWFNSQQLEQVLFGMAINASYSLGEKSSVGIALAINQRAADMQERYIKFLATGFDRYDYLGNPQLKPETNFQSDLMLNHSLGIVGLHLNLFASQIKDYITGVLLPPSIARPVSMGAPGVKQFSNVDKACFTGFEIGGEMKVLDNGSVALSAGYTFAWFPESEKIIMENNQVVGSTVIYNDPIPEIPAFDSELRFTYDLREIKLKPIVSIRAVAGQGRVSESYYEEKTPGYVITDLSVSYTPCKYLTLVSGCSNLFDIAYYDHLNRKILGSEIKLFEPGRSFYLMMKLYF